MEDEYTTVNAEDEYTLTDYIMYKICPKNTDLKYCYIGQTTNFGNRQRQHLKNTVTKSDKKHYHLKHYVAIRENGGWDEWEMIEIEQFNGKTKLEARMREQELIKQHNANLNSVSAFVTEEQRASTKRQLPKSIEKKIKNYLKNKQNNIRKTIRM